MSLSRLHLRTRLDIFNVFFTISSIHSNPSPSPLSQPSPPQYSSRYLRQCLLSNIVDTLFNPARLPCLLRPIPFAFRRQPRSTSFSIAFANVPSYSEIYF